MRGTVIGESSWDEPERDPKEPFGEERMTLGMAKNRENHKKKIAIVIARCEALASRARRKKDTTPSFNFEAKLKTLEEIKTLSTEYQALRKDAFKMISEISYHPDPVEGKDKDFIRTVESHFKSLDESFNLEENYGWKPLK